jgi:hypothetical protein
MSLAPLRLAHSRAALNFLERSNQFVTRRFNVAGDGLSLSFKTQTAPTLFLSADSVISNELHGSTLPHVETCTSLSVRLVSLLNSLILGRQLSLGW